jgi:hypothetical protein
MTEHRTGPWRAEDGRFLSDRPSLSLVPLSDGEVCCVIDNVLARPQAVVNWAQAQRFSVPRGYPYPGVVLDLPTEMRDRIADAFAQHARGLLGGRRTLDVVTRLSLISTPPDQLQPCQWLCHRDRVADDELRYLFAAGVLYLFDDSALGGTSFYRPRKPPEETNRLLADR